MKEVMCGSHLVSTTHWGGHWHTVGTRSRVNVNSIWQAGAQHLGAGVTADLVCELQLQRL
jgi:hypothetical protein